MSSVNNDYTSLWNQQKLNNANSILGTKNTNVAGLSGDLLQQWAMLGANKSAYKKLLEAEKTGTIKQNQNYSELLSDKYFNDNYDNTTGKLIKPTYKPISSQTPEIDKEATSGDVMNDMRSLALAAINNPNSLNSTHYDFFEKMRQTIASGLVTKGSSSDGATVTTEEAKPAEIKKTTDFRLLLDDQRFTVAGKKGETSYSFGIGTSLEDIAKAINADAAATGVKAEVVEADGGKYEIKLTSEGAGKDQFVRVDQAQGDLFASAGSSLSGVGVDAVKGSGETVATGDDTQAAIAVGLYTGKLFSDQTFTIQGAKGAEEFSFAKGATADDIVSAINAASEQTGVKAEIIRNAQGEAEAIGLLADKAGSGNYVQATQKKGDLFAAEGKTVSVAGSSAKKGEEDGPAINNLNDLGRVSVGGQSYSFADLAPGGKASLANNPDAALAILDQAMKDIYEGRAVIKDFDPSTTYVPGLEASANGANASTNTLEIGNYGSDAMKTWITRYGGQDD